MQKLSIASVFGVLLWLGIHTTDDRDKRNPASNPAESIWADTRVPEVVRQTLARSCADCHSNRVKWLLVSRFPLLSNVFENDVYRARKQLNLSEWQSFRAGPAEDVQGTLNGICEEARMQNMPPKRYRLLHPGTEVSAPDAAMLCRWAETGAGHEISGH